MDNPIKFYLVRGGKIGNLEADFQKIIDYLLTFVGEVGVKKEAKGLATISYTETALKATLKTDDGLFNKDTAVSSQITLICEKDDNLSVNLIKNVTQNMGYRIFNPQTSSYLVNDVNLMDLTTVKVEPIVANIFEKYKLTPLFQYRNSLVFFARDASGRIHLINRHLLEYLVQNPQKKLFKKDFSVVMAKDIGRFTALFDRGLIPVSYYQSVSGNAKIINLSGLNIDKLPRTILVEPIFFNLDLPQQSFVQASAPSSIKAAKGRSLIKILRLKKFLSVKIAQDIGFEKQGQALLPRLSVSVYLDTQT